ncbi:hypothetical protein QUB68_28605 [Microcoleus sp. A006_D1]
MRQILINHVRQMTDDICWRAIAPAGFCRSSAIAPAVILWLVLVFG